MLCSKTVLLVSVLVAPITGQRLLLPNARSVTAAPVSIQLGSKSIEAAAGLANLTGPETFVFLPNTLADDDSEAALTEVLSWLRSSRNVASRRLFVFTAGSMGEIDLSESMTVIVNTLRDLVRNGGDTAPYPVDPRRLYETLVAVLPEDSLHWQTLHWCGRLPDLDLLAARYASARLLWLLGERHIALRLVPPTAEVPTWLAGIPTLPTDSGPKSPARVEIQWKAPVPRQGFLLQEAEVLGANPETFGFTAVLAASNRALPSLDDYVRLRVSVDAATQPGAGEPQLRTLESALTVNPSDPDALNAGAALAVRLREPALAATLLSTLLEIDPHSASLKRRYALALFDCCRAAEARDAVEKALVANPGDAVLIENLGRVALALAKPSEAISRFKESLAIDPKNETLWWILADTARSSSQSPIEAEALDSALRLNPNRLDRRTRLISLYLQLSQMPKAREWITPVLQTLPDELPVVTEYAQFWEKLSEPDHARAHWLRATTINSSYEPGYASATRISLESGRAAEALTTALAGLKVAPQSARLHLFHGQALLALNRWNDARLALRSGLPTQDLALLRASAETEDSYGRGAAAGWLRYATLLPVSAPDRKEALSRARFVALRDSDEEILSSKKAQGPGETDTSISVASTVAAELDSIVIVPGGIEALAFIARMPRTPPSEFLHDYSLAVVRATAVANQEAAKKFREEVNTYFDLMNKLRVRGTVKHLSVTIPLSVADKKRRDQTNVTLSLLGYRLRQSGGKTAVDAGIKSAVAERQSLLSALAVDEIEMEETLEAGKTFTLEYEDSIAPILFGYQVWLREFKSIGGIPGGFSQFLAQNTDAARLYAALSSCGTGAAEILYRKFGLRQLADKYSGRILYHGHALNLVGNTVHFPGGSPAMPVWRTMVGADPTDPASFLPALVTRDDGRLLAWFANLSQLTEVRQRFLTQNLQRAQAFYAIFKEAPEFRVGPDQAIRESPVLEFIKQLPIATDGSVDFPGGASIWQVAKGQSDLSRVSKLLRKAGRIEPAEEDEILLRLIRQRYDSSGDRFSQAENFLAVARMDARRTTPLTPAEALILSQQYAANAGAFSYLGALTALGEQEFTAFFRFSAASSGLSDTEVNPLLAHFNSIAKVLCILSANGTLSQEKAAALFLRLCESLTPRAPPSSWTIAATDIWNQILPEPSPAGLTDLLYPRPAPSSAVAAFHEVLKLQKIPGLDNLLALVGLARQVALAHNNPAAVPSLAAEIEKRAAALPVMPVPKKSGARKEQREVLESQSVNDSARILRETIKKAGRKKPNPKDFEKLSTQLLDQLSGPLSLSSLGIVYAWYLRPTDLLVSEDPWLVRKHQFVELDAGPKRSIIFQPTSFTTQSERMGSFVAGSLGDFAVSAGEIGTSARAAAARLATPAYAAQLASIRSRPFAPLTEADLRLVHLRILLGREWLIHAVLQAEARPALTKALDGRVSQYRLRAILDSIVVRNAATAISYLSLSDLHSLGLLAIGLPSIERWPSSLWKAIEIVTPIARPARLHTLGPVIPETFGHDLPRLEDLPPYEDVRQYLMPSRVARRTAEFKLALACFADRKGISGAVLDSQAELLLARAIEQAKMSDPYDWQTLISVFREVNDKWLVSSQGGALQ